MITSLKLKNFQKHGTLKLKLGPVTTIIGPSDIGKSAIIRALTWVLLNLPRGSAFIRKGSKQTQAQIRLDGQTILRTRGKGGNHYFVGDDKFTAFGNKVPDEISKLVNMSEINFQGQHDPSGFWFNLTPGEVSKQLNKVVDLSSVDTTLANLNSSLRKTDLEISIVEKRLASAQEEREKHLHAKQARADLKALEALEDKAQKQGQTRAVLAELLADIAARKAASLRLLEAHVDLLGVSDKEETWLAALANENALFKLVRDLKKAHRDAGIEVPNLKHVSTLNMLWHKEQAKVSALEDLIAKLQEKTRETKSLKKKHQEAKDDLHERIGDTCPLCGSVRDETQS